MPLTVELPDDVREYVEAQIADNRYASAEECIVAVVRAYRQGALDRLKVKLLEALQSPSIRMTPEEWERFDAEMEARIEKAGRP